MGIMNATVKRLGNYYIAIFDEEFVKKEKLKEGDKINVIIMNDPKNA